MQFIFTFRKNVQIKLRKKTKVSQTIYINLKVFVLFLITFIIRQNDEIKDGKKI